MNRAIGKNSQVLQILAREIQELISQEEIDMEGDPSSCRKSGNLKYPWKREDSKAEWKTASCHEDRNARDGRLYQQLFFICF